MEGDIGTLEDVTLVCTSPSVNFLLFHLIPLNDFLKNLH